MDFAGWSVLIIDDRLNDKVFKDIVEPGSFIRENQTQDNGGKFGGIFL